MACRWSYKCECILIECVLAVGTGWTVGSIEANLQAAVGKGQIISAHYLDVLHGVFDDKLEIEPTNTVRNSINQ